ncbi:MAG: T9SS type A sorting domain-containing protein, partial [Bacteroidetes bacterium]|nr:T9SS type A sorting domain-containing protein [Bacteroidota bacterium]
ATSAELDGPQDIFIDASNNLYIADLNNNVIRKVNATTGKITTLAGSGTAGYSGDGGMATSAKLHSPMGVCVSATGNIYIADQANNVIRKVSITAGVENINAFSFQLAPNPSNGKFSILCNTLNSVYEITIYNMEGQIIYHNTAREKKANIDLSNVVAGTYFIYINAGTEKSVQQIIINR